MTAEPLTPTCQKLRRLQQNLILVQRLRQALSVSCKPMRKILPFIALYLLLVGCSTKSDDFQSYISRIQTLSTPLTFQTTNKPNAQQDIIEEKLFSKYKYIYADKLYGIIYKTENSLAILYLVNGDVVTPVIVTYDKKGNKVDSLNLFKNASGLDEDHQTFVSTTLYADMTIKEIDSTLIRHEIKVVGHAADWPRIQIDTLYYTVSSFGKIIKN
jgi:hypothetical protein